MDEQLHKIRHSASHVLAQAVISLYPNVKLGIGPAIEDGFYYDFDNLKITEEDLPKIEAKMKEIIKQDLKFIKLEKTKKDAEKVLIDQPYKLELLHEIDKPTFYQDGNFIDLCAGHHVNSTKEIKAIKLLSIAGAYWKGDSKNQMLTRIYGIAFTTEDELKKYLFIREEAEKRDHRKIGKQLDLFSFHDEAPGFAFWHPKGIIIWNELLDFWRKEHKKAGYKEIKTPIVLNKELWLQSGHWDHYRESMYFTKIDEKDYAVKPMNCPGGILVYKNSLHSYRELPLRLAEVGLVHRHELSGVLAGLFRVRAFHQDDAHIYCTEEQIKSEVKKMIQLFDYFYNKIFKLEYHLELSTRPEKAMGSLELWGKAEKALAEALTEEKIDYKLNPGDGAFYGPKIDFHLKDCLGRTWQCGTIQLDFQMPERFDLSYEGADGKKHIPVMLHRTLYGSVERFIGILTEHHAGKFPLWLSPVQVKVLTVNDRNVEFAKEVVEKLKEHDIRVELDDRTETIPKKVRDAQLEKVNYSVTIGDKEIENKTLAIRSREGKVQFGVKIEDFIKQVTKEIEDKS